MRSVCTYLIWSPNESWFALMHECGNQILFSRLNSVYLDKMCNLINRIFNWTNREKIKFSHSPTMLTCLLNVFDVLIWFPPLYCALISFIVFLFGYNEKEQSKVKFNKVTKYDSSKKWNAHGPLCTRTNMQINK